jgi:hypothetical protein
MGPHLPIRSGHLALAVVAAWAVAAGPARADDPSKGPTPQAALINKQLADAWKANKVTPSRKATDAEFVRRATLDVIGRIATPEEVLFFLNDRRPSKRAELVHRLLYEDNFRLHADGRPAGPKEEGTDVRVFNYVQEYARHWADVWTVWLMTRGGPDLYREQMRIWLQEQFARNVPHDKLVRTLLTAAGKTNGDDDEPAVNFILAHLGEELRGRAAEEGRFEAVPITSRTTRLFLGIQTQCVQCHDHPLNPEWKQSHFWGVNAFFRQVERKGTPPNPNNPQRMQTPTPLTLLDETTYNPNGIVFYERRNGQVLPTRPVFLDGKKPSPSGSLSRRQALADLVVGHDNFARAYVNRLWGHFFGRGLNEQPAVDDFGDHNPVVHKELLDELGKAFHDYKYDSKQLIAWICASDAYSLSSVANPTNAKPEAEVFFSRMLIKAMSPEVLFESLMTAVQPEITLETRSARRQEEIKRLREKSAEERKKLKGQWLSRLVQNFGDDEGNEITFNGTVVQALLLMNGKELNDEILRTDRSAVALAVARNKNNSRGIINDLFLIALNRYPTPQEVGLITRKAYTIPTGQPGQPGKSGKSKPGVQEVVGFTGDVTFYQDLLWALLNSNEFFLNH